MRFAIAVGKDYTAVVGHAGQHRHWLVVEAEAGGEPRAVARVELEKHQVFHHWEDLGPHPLDGIDVLIAASSGEGFLRRMEKRGVEAVLTRETDPVLAVREYLGHTLPPPKPRPITGLFCKARDLFSKH